jgi:hypothetical protein
MSNKTENLKYVLTQINDRIKFADQKASFFASFNLIWVLVQLKFLNLENFSSCLYKFILLLFLLSWIFSIIFLFLILYPRLNNKTKKSKIYFCHIANKYKDNKISAIKDFNDLTEDEFKEDLSIQIVENSIITKRKYKLLQILFLCFGFFIIASIIIQFINN